MIKTFFAAILAFFQMLLGIGVSTDQPETPPTDPVSFSYTSSSTKELNIGDYINLDVSDGTDASAKIVQTNGDRFTVEISVTANPDETIIIITGESIHNYIIPESGTLVTNIKTNSVKISVMTI